MRKSSAGRSLLQSFSRHRAALLSVALLLVLLAARDPLLTYVVNRQLKKVPDVDISFASLHLNVVPGSLTLRDVAIARRPDGDALGGGNKALPLAQVRSLSVRWRYGALVKGTLAASAALDGVTAEIWRVEARRPKAGERRGKAARPAVPSERETIKELMPDPPPPETIQAVWPEIARFLLPVSLDAAEVADARVVFHDLTVRPPVHFPIEGIAVSASNLTNRAALSEGDFGHVSVRAAPAGGALGLEVELDPLAKRPTFSLRGTLDHLQVPKVNDILRAYAKFDTSAGEVHARFAFRCQKGRYAGTIEPRVEGLEIRPQAEDAASNTWLNRLYRKTVGAVTSLLEDNKTATIASKVPLAGEFAEPEIGVGTAIFSLLGNAFIKALTPGAADAPEGRLTPKQRAGRPEVPPLPPQRPGEAGTGAKARAHKGAKPPAATTPPRGRRAGGGGAKAAPAGVPAVQKGRE